MSLPLVKRILRNSFWDYPAYIPKPRWAALTDVCILRESLYHSAMRSSAIRRLPLPLPRFWQGLPFPVAVAIQRMYYALFW